VAFPPEGVAAVFQSPNSLQAMLSLLAPCFTRPTFQTFSALFIGTINRVRDRTICGMLQASGMAGIWHHARAHDFFAKRRWNPDELGFRLLDFIIKTLIGKDEPLRIAVDDTLFGRSGRQVFGAHYQHDGAQPEGSGKRTRLGNCWVVLVIVICLPCLGQRAVGLPIFFRHFEPKDDQHPDRPSQPQLARGLVDMILKRYPDREVQIAMDGAYPNHAMRGLPQRVSWVARMRRTAAVYEPAPPRTGKPGRPALKGKRMPSLTEIADNAIFEPVTVRTPGGRERTVSVYRFSCLWWEPFRGQLITVLLIRNPGTEEGFDIALASTGTAAGTAELICRYDGRWVIETCHQEAKAHGVGQARNRTRNAVLRTVPFGFLCQTITILSYQQFGNT
jgi:hypothetical protein